MNSTKILFLKMLRNDIKRKACEKMGVDFNQVPKGKEELLTGQTIGRSDIESFSSYKLMNEDEKSIVNSILNEMKTKDSNGVSMNGRVLSKHIDSLVPTSIADAVEYKEAA